MIRDHNPLSQADRRRLVKASNNRATNNTYPETFHLQDELRSLQVEVDRFANRRAWLMDGAPAVVAVLSIIVSIYTWAVTQGAPEVTVHPPGEVRVTQGPESGWLYVEPIFLNTSAQSERIEMITNMTLQVKPPSSDGEANLSRTVEFKWDEQGEWSYDNQAQELTWEYRDDPGPFPVPPAEPQSPTALFVGAESLQWSPGTYRIDLVAGRTILEDRPLRTSFEITLNEAEALYLNDNVGERFLELPIQLDADSSSPG